MKHALPDQLRYEVLTCLAQSLSFKEVYERFPDIETSVVVFCNSLERSAYDVGGRVSELAVATYKH